MKQNKIGIIGGAGPNAGSLLFNTLIGVCQTKYNCKKDAEFPHVVLLNFPFSDMLSKDKCDETITKELQSCFDSLENYGVNIAAIACNTLHI